MRQKLTAKYLQAVTQTLAIPHFLNGLNGRLGKLLRESDVAASLSKSIKISRFDTALKTGTSSKKQDARAANTGAAAACAT
jgi:hypothetical protein